MWICRTSSVCPCLSASRLSPCSSSPALRHDESRLCANGFRVTTTWPESCIPPSGGEGASPGPMMSTARASDYLRSACQVASGEVIAEVTSGRVVSPPTQSDACLVMFNVSKATYELSGPPMGKSLLKSSWSDYSRGERKDQC